MKTFGNKLFTALMTAITFMIFFILMIGILRLTVDGVSVIWRLWGKVI